MATEPGRRSTDLHGVHVSVAEMLKAAVTLLPCLITIISAIVFFSKWTERVNYRLDDIDKDLKTIHERLERAGGPKPALGTFQLHRN